MIVRDPHEEQRYQIHSVPTIQVIERPTESYSDYHKRMQREEGAKRVPFGFARALEDPA